MPAAAALSLSTPNMAFEIAADATGARFVFPRNTAADKDFWRLILDDGDRTEIPVFSHAQKGRAVLDGDTLTVAYDRLVSAYGDAYDIGFTLRIARTGDVLTFTPTIANRSKVRVNECFAPLVSFNGLVGEKAKDVLYMPRSLGQRSPNPWAKMESFTPLDYLHNEYETSWRLHYPQCSMCWLGIESADKFLYLARLDDQVRACLRARLRNFSVQRDGALEVKISERRKKLACRAEIECDEGIRTPGPGARPLRDFHGGRGDFCNLSRKFQRVQAEGIGIHDIGTGTVVFIGKLFDRRGVCQVPGFRQFPGL